MQKERKQNGIPWSFWNAHKRTCSERKGCVTYGFPCNILIYKNKTNRRLRNNEFCGSSKIWPADIRYRLYPMDVNIPDNKIPEKQGNIKDPENEIKAAKERNTRRWKNWY